MSARMDFYLDGAPNFRQSDLNIHGVSQPTVTGLATVLTVLQSHPSSVEPASVFWFNTREEPVIYIRFESLQLIRVRLY